MIDLKKPGLQVRVQQNIEAQDLEAKLVLNVVWLARPVQMSNSRLSCNQRLDYYIFYFGLTLIDFVISLDAFNPPNVVPDLTDTFLVSRARSLRIVILLISRIQFIDRVISEMHKIIFHIALLGLFIRICCKSG